MRGSFRVVSAAILDMVFYYWISVGKRRSALCFWRRGEGIQEPVRPKVVAENECYLGAVQLCSCYNHICRFDRYESVQQLCVDRDTDWLLVDDADVWDRNQEIPE